MNTEEKGGLSPTIRMVVRGLTSIGIIKVIRRELTMKGIDIVSIGPGQLTLPGAIFPAHLEELLNGWGIELVTEPDQQRLSQTKRVLQTTLESDLPPLRSMLRYLSQQTGCSYWLLNNLFLAVEGVTLGRYVVRQRLDKAIERLVYTHEPVPQIARRTGYRDEEHLCQHLASERGLPIAHFLRLRANRLILSADIRAVQPPQSPTVAA